MNDKLSEAIGVMKDYRKGDFVDDDDFCKAIDTVVDFCEKQLQCDCVIGWEGDMPITFKMCDNCKSKI